MRVYLFNGVWILPIRTGAVSRDYALKYIPLVKRRREKLFLFIALVFTLADEKTFANNNKFFFFLDIRSLLKVGNHQSHLLLGHCRSKYGCSSQTIGAEIYPGLGVYRKLLSQDIFLLRGLLLATFLCMINWSISHFWVLRFTCPKNLLRNNATINVLDLINLNTNHLTSFPTKQNWFVWQFVNLRPRSTQVWPSH